ncbi:fba, partial [Symbiodinium sp. CCMP2456]
GCAVALAGVGAYAAAQAFVAPTAPQVQEQREVRQLRQQAAASVTSTTSSAAALALGAAGVAAAAAQAGKRTQRRCQVVRQATAVAEKTFTKMPASVKPGVVTGQALVDLLNYAKENEFAIPGVNVEPLEENISICKKYLERMSKVDLLLEMELGVTGGEEDGVDNTDVDSSRLYTQPEEVWQVYETLSAVPNGRFTVAAAFGNVHGVYAPGNVSLKPVILHNTQKFIKEKLGTDDDKPVSFVFHGGSGSSLEDIRYAIEAGVIKMNIDTDTQWAFWDGMNEYQKKNKDYLQGQIGNPEGPEKPNKKYYDPRMSLRAGEETMADRLVKCMEDLKCIDRL